MTTELTELGYSKESEDRDAQQLLILLVSSFAKEVVTMIYGMDERVSNSEEGAGATINRELRSGMKKVCQEAGLGDGGLETLRQEVQTIIVNLHGIRDPLMAPIQALEIIVDKLVERYRVPAVDLINNIRQTIMSRVQAAALKHFGAYPVLQVDIKFDITFLV